MSKNVLILGVNGFIGSHLTEAILEQTQWHVYGMDIAHHNIAHLVTHPRMHFCEGDITINKEWIEYHIKKADVVLPLVAIATPSTYVNAPLRVFELDFEANLNIVRRCVAYQKRIVFPSTSEVYGMCTDDVFDETQSSLVLGPIHKQRWIYSASKQLLDRVIYAYGQQGAISFTLFRPFNWFGPRLDNVFAPKEGSSRVLTQFISNIIHGRDIQLVDGGEQRRCLTYIEDGISALMRIMHNTDGCAHNRLFNLGNPANDISIRALAEAVIAAAKSIPAFADNAARTQCVSVDAKCYYGSGYQDIRARVPAITQAKQCLHWAPQVTLTDGLARTLTYYAEAAKQSAMIA